MPFDPGDDGVEIVFALEVAKQEWPRSPLGLRVSLHHAEVGPDEWGEVDLVNDEEIAGANRGSTFSWDFVSFGDIDDVNERIDQLWGKGGGEIVAAAFDEQQLETGEFRLQCTTGLLVHRRVVADRGVRTSAGFDSSDPFGRQCRVPNEELSILRAIDVIGHYGHRVTLAQALTELEAKHRLARADWAADADTRRARHVVIYDLRCTIYDLEPLFSRSRRVFFGRVEHFEIINRIS